jgi:hypothetical protein
MNQKGYLHLEVTKGERNYAFTLPIGAPFGEAYDAAFSVLQEILKMAQEASEKASPVTKDESAASDVLEAQ